MQRAGTRGRKTKSQAPSGGIRKGICIVDEGRSAIEAHRSDGLRIRIGVVQGGAFPGVIAGGPGQERTADVVAETDTIVCRVNSDIPEVRRATHQGHFARFHNMKACEPAEKVRGTTRLPGEAGQ